MKLDITITLENDSNRIRFDHIPFSLLFAVLKSFLSGKSLTIHNNKKAITNTGVNL